MAGRGPSEVSFVASDLDAEVFRALALKAIDEWPKRIDAVLQVYADDAYEVKGLGDLEREIDRPYIGAPHEELVRELHWCVLITLHAVAKYVTVLRPGEIRIEELQRLFVSRLTNVTPFNEEWRLGLIEALHAEHAIRNGA
jgi:hypothetical protein